MSLINDALKRAKQAQPTAPAAEQSNLQLHPAEPTHYVRHSLGFLVPVSLAIAALLVLFLVWQRYERGQLLKKGFLDGSSTLVVEAKSPASQTPAATEPPKAAETAPAPATPIPLAPAPAPAVANTTATNQPPAAEPPAEKPAPLKLQGIVYSPKRPSAVINGRTLFIGDRIREFRVVAITQDSATLAGPQEQQVLRMDE